MTLSKADLKITGIVFVLISLVLGVISYFNLNYVPLAAICISLTILGLTSLALARLTLLETAVFKIIISLIFAFILINVILIFTGNKDITTYFLLNAVIYLILTLIYGDLNPKIRGTFTWINGVIFACFLVILVIKFIETPK